MIQTESIPEKDSPESDFENAWQDYKNVQQEIKALYKKEAEMLNVLQSICPHETTSPIFLPDFLKFGGFDIDEIDEGPQSKCCVCGKMVPGF